MELPRPRRTLEPEPISSASASATWRGAITRGSAKRSRPREPRWAPACRKPPPQELGLLEGTPVGASLIDAHAGGIGTIGGRTKSGDPAEVCRRLAYIMGTSACIMATTEEPRFVPGVWGPYYSGMVPGLWLNEGGQSAAGAAIDHLIGAHPAYKQAVEAARAAQVWRCSTISSVASSRASPIPATPRGWRATSTCCRNFWAIARPMPIRIRAPSSRASISIVDIASMERLFVAGLCGLAYGLADVVDALRAHGVESELMVISGGAARSALVRQIMTDTTGLTVALPETQEPVLLGAAMLGAVAARTYGSIGEAMTSMSAIGWSSVPTGTDVADFHRSKRSVYRLMRQLDQDSRVAMRDAGGACHG